MAFDSRRRGRKDILIALLISLLAIIAILKFTNADISYEALSSISTRFVLLALFLHFLSWLFWSFRIQILATTVGHRASFNLALKTTLASNFLASLMPSSAGGEPVRIKMLADDGMSYGSATAVVLAERLLDGFLFLSAFVVLNFLSDKVTGFGLEVGVVFLLLIIFLLIFLWELIERPERIERLIKWAKLKTRGAKIVFAIEEQIWQFREADIKFARERNRIPAMIAVTIFIWTCEFLVPPVLLVGLGQKPSIILSTAAQIIIAIISLAPLTPGSSGVAELSMSYLYSMFVPSSLLGVLVALWRLITYFTNLIVGAIFVGFSLDRTVKK
ncbi:Lysylphosphatidylglycerol synthase TM region [uncultured archaeon]|nr:Lysylphosphatidylglycerol synthase TM region [uncultured archaeon]